VIKQFGGGTSLTFFEGIKPKIAIRAVAVTAASPALQGAVATSIKPPNATIVPSGATTPIIPVQNQLPPPSGAVIVAPAACQNPQITVNSEQNAISAPVMIPSSTVPPAGKKPQI